MVTSSFNRQSTDPKPGGPGAHSGTARGLPGPACPGAGQWWGRAKALVEEGSRDYNVSTSIPKLHCHLGLWEEVPSHVKTEMFTPLLFC